VPLQDATPALASPDSATAAQAQIAVNMKNAIRNNKWPTAALLRAGYARCGYGGNVLRVLNGKGGTSYRCNTTSRDVHGCPAFAIAAGALDAALWARAEQVLSEPKIIANEVGLLRGTDPNEATIAALEPRIAEVERQQTNLMRRLAAIDDDEVAAPFLVEIKTLGDHHKRLRVERDALLAERGMAIGAGPARRPGMVVPSPGGEPGRAHLRAETARAAGVEGRGTRLEHGPRPAVRDHAADRPRRRAQWSSLGRR
jgi:site-specific DNA recombinase